PSSPRAARDRARPSGLSREPCFLQLSRSRPSGALPGAFQFVTSLYISLPDQREELAAGAGLTRLPIRHHTLRCAEDRHAEPVANARNLRDSDVLAKSRRGHAAHLANHRLPALRVFQNHAQRLAAVFVVERLVVLNEVVLLQDLRDLHLELRDRHVHAAVLRPTGVANAREHIGYRIGHTHLMIFLTHTVSRSR